jgi:predicted DsbA family dithiol-disulfide isomerase
VVRGELAVVAKRLGMQIGKDLLLDWRPFQLAPEMQPGGADKLQHYIAKFGPGIETTLKSPNNIFCQRAARIRAEVPEEKIAFNYVPGSKVFNTLQCHVLMTRVAADPKLIELGNEIMTEMFKRYFAEGKMLDRDGLLAMAADMKLPEDVVREGILEPSAELVAKTRTELLGWARAGINGVPFLIFPNNRRVSGAQEADFLEELVEACRQ